MTSHSSGREHYEITPSLYLGLAVTFAVTIPGIYFGLNHGGLTPLEGSLIFGFSIFAAAFVLSWGAEVIQIDISESLAIAILALIAVLPEYAVDFVFTWKAAHDPSQAQYAIANMTGANRLLVGIGWPAVLGLYILFRKKTRITLGKEQHIEIFYLAMATIYSFTIPLKGYLSLIDTAILVTIFGMYTRRAAQAESVEPELVGPPKILANMSTLWRRVFTAVFFLYAGLVIFLVAEPFAMSLVGMGGQFGINEFYLVQWLAPIASEAPEFIIAATWTMRGAAGAAMKALISSKVNQWTLLVGTIPVVYAISGGVIKPFPLDTLQQHELLLTAAQSLFGVGVLMNLKLSRGDGLMLAGLFGLQFFWADIRMEVAGVYIVLGLVFHFLHRRHLIPALRMGLGLKDRS